MGIEKGRKEGKRELEKREIERGGGIVRSLVRGAGTKWREGFKGREYKEYSNIGI
jgi:hypothetical protein